MKMLASVVLLLEALAVALAIPVAITTSSRGAAAGWVMGILALALLVASGLARRPIGISIGWALQVAVLASALLLPAMLALGLIFLAVWIVALVYGAKADRAAAEHRRRAVPTPTAPVAPEPAAGTDPPTGR